MQTIDPNQAIKIGTLVRGGPEAASYIKQVLPHGFESFSITFWHSLHNTNLALLAAQVKEVMGDSGAIVSSLSMFGHTLEESPRGEEARKGWMDLIDHAHLFGTDLVTGFTGRVAGQPLDASIPRYKEVFGSLATRASDRGVKLAFENCPMGGTWQSGEWNIAWNQTAWEMMFAALPAPNIGVQFEPCHLMCELVDPLPVMRKWLPKIYIMHGKCATVKWDIIRTQGISGPQRWAFHRFPGMGDLRWTDVISELRWGGFRGCIDVEGWHDPVYRGDLEMTGQVYALNYLKGCRGGDPIPNPA
jgi:sugar phosphate isomerase/epimerase